MISPPISDRDCHRTRIGRRAGSEPAEGPSTWGPWFDKLTTNEIKSLPRTEKILTKNVTDSGIDEQDSRCDFLLAV